MRIIVREQGFTLLELMVAVAIVGILLTIGLPSFSATVRQNCTVTSANTLLTVLTGARSEALKRDRNVSICKSANGTACATGTGVRWNQGYLMFVDNNANGAVNTGDTILRTELPLSACASIVGAGNYVNRASFTGLGKATSESNFLIVANNQSTFRRCVVISPSGRPRVCDPDKALSCGDSSCGLP